MATLVDDTEDYVIVLYYQYCTITDVKLTCQEQQQLCNQLSLLGRVRVAEEGLNGTLGGSSHSVAEYMRTVDGIDQFDAVRRPIHWKLSRLQDGMLQQRFTSLKVQAVKEVVSLDLPETVRTAMQHVDAGIHITPAVWHEMLTKTTQSETSLSTTDDPILIDVRNLYETNIGKFIVDTPRGSLQPLDPGTRQFSDFARYVDKEVESLKGKTVMMYCTGGVRCERASTYVRYAIEQAGGAADIYQLSGGIHAYMETYPQGGLSSIMLSIMFCPSFQIIFAICTVITSSSLSSLYQHSPQTMSSPHYPTPHLSSHLPPGFFRGKNFVFDPRIALPSKENQTDIIGHCLSCNALFDDYSNQYRCAKCRTLVLICSPCDARLKETKQPTNNPTTCDDKKVNEELVCTSCQLNLETNKIVSKNRA